MKQRRWMAGLLLLCLACGLLLGGCFGGGQQNQEQQEEQQEQQSEVATLTGEFQGLADGHSAEVIVDGEPQMYQFFEEEIAARLEPMETGTVIQFDVETDAETGLQTMVKLYDEPAEG